MDPPREEVEEAIAQSKSAGIIPIMITGDHPITARRLSENSVRSEIERKFRRKGGKGKITGGVVITTLSIGRMVAS